LWRLAGVAALLGDQSAVGDNAKQEP